MFTERNINVMIIKSKIIRWGTVDVVVSFKIPILESWVQFPDGATVCNFFAFLRNVNSIFTALEQKFTKKPNGPVFEDDSTDEHWALFIDAWGRYKEMCDLTNLVEIRNELKTAYSPNINKFLFHLFGPETLNIAKEEQLLHHIRLVAMKGLHEEVHMRTFKKLGNNKGRVEHISLLNCSCGGGSVNLPGSVQTEVANSE